MFRLQKNRFFFNVFRKYNILRVYCKNSDKNLKRYKVSEKLLPNTNRKRLFHKYYEKLFHYYELELPIFVDISIF